MLEPGKRIERTIAGGESHSYRVPLTTGQFMHVVVDQRGIDIAVRLFDPQQQKSVEVDSPNGAYGPEPLFFVPEADGNYRLEISQLEPDVSAGNYSVSIQELRIASPKDRDLVAAQHTYGEGDQLRAQATADSVNSAFKKYESALQLYRAIGDRRGEAASLYGMGVTNQLLSENKKAIVLYDEARPLWHTVGELTAEAITLVNTGLAYDNLGERQKAVEYYNQSLLLFRAVGDRREESNTLSNIGKVYVSLGEYQKALEHFNQALPFFKTSGKQRETGIILNNIGVTYESMGEYQKAIDFSGEALQLLRKVGDHRAEGSSLVSIANIHFGLGRYQQALDLYNQALPLLRVAGNRQDEAQTLNDIGKCYVLLGDKVKGLDFLDQSLQLSRRIEDHYREAYTLNNIGLVQAESGQNTKAQDSYNQALVLSRGVLDLHGEALTLNNIGSLYASSGEKAQALDSLRQALAINRALRERSDEGNTLANLMFAWKGFQRPSLAIFYGKQAVNAFQEIRTRVQKLERELQSSYLNSKEKVYRELAGLLISQGRLPEAQQVLRFLKEEEYYEFIRRDSNDPVSLSKRATLTPEEAEWERRYQAIAEQIAAIGRERGELLAKEKRTAEEDQRLVALERKLEVGNQHFQVFLNQLAEEFSDAKHSSYRVAALRDTQALQSDLRELGRGTVALFTIVGEEKYRVIVVTPDAQIAREYPIRAAELNRKVLDFREALQNPRTDPIPLAQELYKILVDPVSRDLKQAGATTLMWSLDGVLRYLPVSALHDGHRYMVEQYRNVVFTIASNTRLKDVPSAHWKALGMGVSKALDGFPPLPAVPKELRGIIRESRSRNFNAESGVLPGKIMLDEAFTQQAMRNELRTHYPLVHIASHFQFNPGDETDSFLLLGDGNHLTLTEVKRAVNLFDGVELLTLSACDTATGGASADGKEVEAFAVMAQRQGAKAVLAGLWPVVDTSTRLLMQNFYRLRVTKLHLSKAEALRQAQLSLLGREKKSPSGTRRNLKLQIEKDEQTVDYSHPFFWAPFILIGNWK